MGIRSTLVRWVGLWVLAALASGWGSASWGQEPPPPNTTPAAEETGEREGGSFHFPPLSVDPRIFAFDQGPFAELARRIEDGTATLVERRAFWLLDDRLYPYDKPIPADWRARAAADERRLRPVRGGAQDAAGVPPGPEASYTWTSLGPTPLPQGSDKVSGRATALWVDPADINTILLGTADGGVYKTTNQGTSWTMLFSDLPSLSIGALAVDPNNKQVIYVGTGEGNFSADLIGGMGMFKSVDGGASWSALTLPSWSYAQPYHNIRRIAVDPNNSNNVYAAVDGGLLYSTNAGTSWTKSTCGASGGTLSGTDLVLVSSTSPTTVLVAFGYYGGAAANGIFRATAGAGPWTKISGSGNGFPTTNVGRITLLQAPSDLKQVYALVSNSSTRTNLGVYNCPDTTLATPAWTLKNSTTSYCSSQCWYDMTGAVNPTDPTRLVVGGVDNYGSKNGGTTLTSISCWSCSGSSLSHADHHHMVFANATTLYDANDGGFFIGTVNWTTPSATWVNRNATLGTLQFYGLAQHPTDATKFQGGLQDNGQAYFNGTAWSRVRGGDGGWSAWDQSNASYAYEEYVYAGIYRNSNMTGTPTSWTCIQNFNGCSGCSGSCTPDSRTGFIAPFTLDANNQNTMWAGSYHIYKNTNPRGSNTWSSPSTTDLAVSGGYINFIHSAKNNGTPGTLYTGSSTGKLWVSTDDGVTWTDRSSGLSGNRIKSIATDPANGSRVLVAVSGWDGSRVYRSTNGGANWTNISGALPQIPANSITLDPADANRAYVGMDMGVYMNTNVWGGTTWTSITGNLPAVSNFQLEVNPANGKLRTATHGLGIWELTVSTATPKEASPSGDLLATRGAGTTVNATYTAGCGATDHTVYAGSLATLGSGGISWSSRYCAKGTSGSLSFDPGSASVYFVVVANDGSQEGSYGTGAQGERAAAGAGSPCAYTQNLGGTCP